MNRRIRDFALIAWWAASAVFFAAGLGAAPAFTERTIVTTGADQDVTLQKIIEKYDVRGNLLESDRYLPNGTLETRNTWQYDRNNRKTSESRYDCNGGLCTVITFRYDSDGTPMERYKALSLIPLGAVEFENPPSGSAGPGVTRATQTNTVYLRYGGEGLLLAKRRVDCSGSVCQIINYFYDRRNRQIDEDYYDPDSRLLKRVKSSYDTNERVTGLSVYDSTGGLIAQSTFEYDPEGRLLRKSDYDPATGELTAVTWNSWDADRLGASETRDSQGRTVGRTEYGYDSWGRIQKEAWSKPDPDSDPVREKIVRIVTYRYR